MELEVNLGNFEDWAKVWDCDFEDWPMDREYLVNLETFAPGALRELGGGRLFREAGRGAGPELGGGGLEDGSASSRVSWRMEGGTSRSRRWT